MTHQPLGLSRWTRAALVSLFSLTLVTTFAMGSRPSYAEENPTSGVAEGAETTPSAETGEQGSEAFDTDSSDEETLKRGVRVKSWTGLGISCKSRAE